MQSTLVGKAREAYSALSIEESCQYEVVKASVLKVFELLSEAYRQKFRSTTKQESQTYVEFAREKETLFNRWCTSKEINNLEQLRQLLLVEEFKKCLPNEVKTYLDEKKVETLSQAAVLADDYILTHKSISNPKPLSTQMNSHAEPFHPNPKTGQNQPRGYTGSAPGNIRPQLRFSQTLPKGPKCYHCRKRGHVMADCWYLKGPNQGSTKPTMMSVKAHANTVSETVLSNLIHPAVPQEYRPFLSCGYVCLLDSNVEEPIMILRDTGANQSLLLEGTLPVLDQTSTGADVLIQGVYQCASS